jgi:hypothetical protein
MLTKWMNGRTNNNKTKEIDLKEIKNRLQEGSAFIVLNVMDEVWCDRETINIMHEYFDNRDIPRTSVIYITNGPNYTPAFTD